MAREASSQTLQPTALVHEAWIRLGGSDTPGFQSRAHFFGAAAEAMRRILIDNARRIFVQLDAGRAVEASIVGRALSGLGLSPVPGDFELVEAGTRIVSP